MVLIYRSFICFYVLLDVLTTFCHINTVHILPQLAVNCVNNIVEMMQIVEESHKDFDYLKSALLVVLLLLYASFS